MGHDPKQYGKIILTINAFVAIQLMKLCDETALVGDFKQDLTSDPEQVWLFGAQISYEIFVLLWIGEPHEGKERVAGRAPLWSYDGLFIGIHMCHDRIKT